MSFISLSGKFTKTIIIIAIVTFLYIGTMSFMLGALWAHRKITQEFMAEQHKLNTSITRVIAKMSAAIAHNYDFNKTNKKFIQNIAEIYVPDEVALLRTIPAKQ
jgi:hypothetical protein